MTDEELQRIEANLRKPQGYAIEHGHPLCIKLARLLVRMTQEERRALWPWIKANPDVWKQGFFDATYGKSRLADMLRDIGRLLA